MTGLIISSSKKPVNKWLIGLMLFTVILTAWTAFNDNAKDEDMVTSNNVSFKKPTQQGVLQKSLTPLDKVNREPLEIKTNEIKIAAESSTLIPWQQLMRKQLTTKPYNLFKVHSWVVASPIVKQKPQPAPPPVAPPAPFTYMGKLEDPIKGTQVFLTLNGRLYSVFKGEKIDQQWRFDTENDNNISLTFLPLNLPQVLSKAAKPILPITPTEPVVAETNT